MDAAMVAQVRRFNRTVTQRVGALQDEFLGRGRPLGAARVLWEIGPVGRDVRELRADLGLDSGYLSRLLRSLEAAGLVEVFAATDDRRVGGGPPSPPPPTRPPATASPPTSPRSAPGSTAATIPTPRSRSATPSSAGR